MDISATIRGFVTPTPATPQICRAIRYALIIALFVYCSIHSGAYSATQTSGRQSVSFTTIDQGTHSGVQERRSLVIKTSEEWQNLLKTHRMPFGSAKAVARIDFEEEMVVAVFSGTKPSGGYRIEVTAIEEDRVDRQLIITIRESKPLPGAVATQALTQPYHMVRLKKLELPIVFSSG